MTTFERRTFSRDLAACLALSDQRRAENAAALSRVQGNAELVSHLAAGAQRRGQGGAIDWADYFRNAWIA